MLNNNTEYKQKMEKDNDNNYKAWLVYSYPENIMIDERGRIFKKIWDLDIEDIDSVKEFKKEYLYDRLNLKYSNYNFNDTLFQEIEEFNNNMFAQGKRKRKRKKRKTKRKNMKEKKQKNKKVIY
tara:strand:- start:4409 stop:4780 length:372 start_codon:yes stop_codon:yes gene_type:complete